MSLSAVPQLHAQDATWGANPPSGDFNTPSNWTPATVPTGNAFFGASNIRNIALSADTSIDGWMFKPGAGAYTITNPAVSFYSLEFFGAGIIVNGGGLNLHNESGALLFFWNSSTAGGGSTAGGVNITNNGSINFRDTSTAGTANFTNNNGLYFYQSSSADRATITNYDSAGFAGNATAANATITNNGYLGISQNATAANATIVNNRLIRFDGDSTAANATITTNTSGRTQFHGDTTGGAARFIFNGNGTLDISGLTNGGMTAGSIEGNGNITLGSNALTVGGNNRSTLFSGVIDGDVVSGLLKAGTGTLTLNGVNTFTGDVTVRAGALLVNGSIASAAVVRVDAGAMLGGTGAVPGTIVYEGGTLAPGTPQTVGALTVNTSLIFDAHSLYHVKVTSSSNDRARVVMGTGLGDAYLDGAMSVSSANGTYRFGTPYTVLTAEGAFAGPGFTSLSLPTGLGGSLNYVPTLFSNDVHLTLSSNLSSVAGLGANQRTLASLLDAQFNSSGVSGAFGGVFGDDVSGKLKQLSGQSSAGVTQISGDASNAFMGAMFDPFASGRMAGASAKGFAAESDVVDAMAYASNTTSSHAERDARNAVFAKEPRNNIYDPRWSIWGSAYGGSTTTDGSVAFGTNSVTARAFGFVTGADYNLTRNTTVGFALGGGGSNYGFAGNLGSGRADMFQAGLFAKHMMGAAYVAGGLGYTFQNVTTDRTVTIAGNDQLQAKFNAHTFAGRIEGGYRFATSAVGITPYAALQVTHIGLPSYSEAAIVGNNTFALNYATQNTTIVRTELGARFDKSFALPDTLLTLRSRAAWAHDEGNNRNVAAVFGSLPGSNFIVTGPAPSKDRALVSAGTEVTWLNNVTLAGTFEGQFSSTTIGYGGKGTARYTW